MSQRDDFASRLQLLVDRSGLSQEKYARLVDVSTTAINLWLRRERGPGLVHVIKIADLEHVSLDWLAAHDLTIAGISLARIEEILRHIDEDERWQKHDLAEKLTTLATIYTSFKGASPHRVGGRKS